jgi:hypothetical protein
MNITYLIVCCSLKIVIENIKQTERKCFYMVKCSRCQRLVLDEESKISYFDGTRVCECCASEERMHTNEAYLRQIQLEEKANSDYARRMRNNRKLTKINTYKKKKSYNQKKKVS